jgi:nickel-dependent lactate racemase
MRVAMACGRERLEFEVAEGSRIASRPPPAALPDPVAAVRESLEAPFDFPPLRRALTPDDHIAVLIDEELPHVGELLTPVLEHILSADVSPQALTLLCPPGAAEQPWADDLSPAFRSVRREVHDPADRARLAYLATTAGGRRLYLNRTLVEADQVVVLTGRRYDPLLGHGGAEGAIFPALGDAVTRAEVSARPHFEVPGVKPWPLRQEAVEVSWLLGQPFYVQGIAGPGDALSHVVAGAAKASREGQRLLDACWRQGVARQADLVVVGLGGDPARHTFAGWAAAVACAAHVVKPGGRIVLLTPSRPDLCAGTEVLRREDEPQAALKELRRAPSLERGPALQWVHAAGQARLYVLSGLPDETVEELFATPLQDGGQVQRLIAGAGACLFLEDAHKMMAFVA